MPPQGFRVEGATELKVLAAELKVASPVLLRAMRRSLRAAVKPVADDAKQVAAGFSKTIPGSIVIRTKFTGRSATVAVVALASKLKEGHQALARLEEFGSRRNPSTIRHPTFGHDPWVDQPSHPFLLPTARRHAPQVEVALRKVMDETARAAGFK